MYTLPHAVVALTVVDTGCIGRWKSNYMYHDHDRTVKFWKSKGMRFYKIDEDQRKNTKHQMNFPEIWGKNVWFSLSLHRTWQACHDHKGPYQTSNKICGLVKLLKNNKKKLHAPCSFGSYIVYFFSFAEINKMDIVNQEIS